MKGIDISAYQTNIDWSKVKASGIDFAFIKATQGVGITDHEVVSHSVGALAAGVKRGFYAFGTLNNQDVVSDAMAEANYFLKVVKTLDKPDLPLVLDLETNTIKVKPEDVVKYILTYKDIVNKSGFDFMLYSGLYFLNENLPANHELGNIPLWLAEYGSKPNLPKGWNNYWIWQYTDSGKVDGIPGNVDLDIVNEKIIDKQTFAVNFALNFANSPNNPLI